ncbi:MAG: RHS repeat-associated core domain-containing protein [Acidimicrobiia bacterium]
MLAATLAPGPQAPPAALASTGTPLPEEVPPGPPPDPLPDSEREVPPPAIPEVPDHVPLPSLEELFAPEDSARDLIATLEENFAEATETMSVYEQGGADHWLAATVQPQNYLDDQGNWHDIDTSLVHLPEGKHEPVDLIPPDLPGFTNAEGMVQVLFPDVLSALTPLIFALPEGRLDILPSGLFPAVPGVREGESVRYSDAAESLDLVYTATPLGYEEWVVLKEPPPGDRASWRIQATHLALRLEESGEISILAGDEVVGAFPPTLVGDSSQEPESAGATTSFPYELQDLGGGRYELSVLYDQAWLSDPDRVYPVVIDPGPQERTRYPTDDTFSYSASPDTPQGSWWNVQAGGGGGQRTFVNFDTKIYERANRVVYFAQLSLAPYPAQDSTTEGTVYVRRITSSWSEDTLTHNFQPSVGTANWDSADEGDVDGGWQNFTGLGALYQRFLDTSDPNHYTAHRGVRLHSANSNWHVWCSSNSNLNCPSSAKPILFLTFNDLPAAAAPDPNGPIGTEADPGIVTVESPELVMLAMPTDFNNDPTRLNFQVSKSGTSWEAPDLVAQSGWINSTTWAVPAGALKDGQSYHWRTQSGDWCGDWDDMCSNEDASGRIHPWKTSAVQTIKVNLPKYGSDERWAMWSDQLGNGMSLQVNQANGNLYLDYPLDTLQTPAGPLDLALTYNNQQTADIGLGPGWNVSAGPLSDSLKLPTTLTVVAKNKGGGVLIAYGDGDRAHFPKLAGTTYQSAGVGTVFKNDGSQGWTYVTDAGGTFTFDSDGALLTAAPSSNQYGDPGFSYLFEPDPSRPGVLNLKRVADPLGRAVDFAWTGSPTHLTSITTWVPKKGGGGNQTWTLAYSSDRLFEVADPVSQTVRFTHEGGLLTGIQDGQLVADARDEKTAITYVQETLPDDRVIYRAKTVTAPPTVQGGQVHPTEFVYDPPLNGDIVTRTAAIDPRGPTTPENATDYMTWTDFNDMGLPIRVEGPYDQLGKAPITRMLWNSEGNLLCSRSPAANRDGGVNEKCKAGESDIPTEPLNTAYEYQAVAPFKPTKVTGPAPNPDGSGERAVTEYQYDQGIEGLALSEYTNATMTGLPYNKRIAGPINGLSPDWDWGPHGQPGTLPPDTTDFSLRFTGTITAASTGTYKFRVRAGGGSRLVVGPEVIDCWAVGAYPNCGDTQTLVIKLEANKSKPVSLEYRYVDAGYGARLAFQWDPPGSQSWENVPATAMDSALSLVTSVVDPKGTTTRSYPDDPSKFRELPASTTRAGRTTTYSYGSDPYGRVLSQSVSHPDGPFTTSYVYTDTSTTSCLTRVTDPTGAVTDYTCDEAGQVTQVRVSVPAVPGTNQNTDQVRITDTKYDDLGRPESVTVPHPEGQGPFPDTQYDYDRAGRLTQTTDPMGFVTTNEYGLDGRLTKTLLPSPDGSSPRPETTYGYDGEGNRTSVVDPRDHTWTTSYDALNRLTSTTTPAGTDADPAPTYTTNTVYDLLNRTTTVTTPGGLDAAGNPVSITQVTTHDILGRAISAKVGDLTADTFSYDVVGNQISQTADGITTITEYNAYNQPTKETCQGCAGGQDAVTHFAYDQSGRLVEEVDARGSGPTDQSHMWKYGYDGAGRLTSAQLPAPISATTSIVYDAAGEQVKVTDGAGYVRNYTYDERGRLATLATARGTIAYVHDVNDRLVRVDLPTSTPPLPVASLNYAYDNLGQRTRRWGLTSGGQTVSGENFSFDSAGNLTRASSDSLTIPAVVMDYDFAHRPWRVTQGTTVTTLAYQGTQLSSRSVVAAGSTLTNNYRYRTGDGLLATISPAFGGSNVAYGYDPYGRATSRQDPSGLTSVVAYDQTGRVKSKQVNLPSSSPLVCFERVYDPVGNVIQEAQRPSTACATQPEGWNTYAYDNANRLESATEGGVTTAFGYDGAANRTSVQVGGDPAVTTSYDDAGYPDSASDGTDYVTDALGELMSITKGGSTSSFVYDAWGRTSSAATPSGSFTYVLDALDRTISKAAGLSSTSFAYVGTTEDPAAVTSGATTTHFDYTTGGPLAERTGATVRYDLLDLHGDVVGLALSGGSSEGSATFDAWGTKTASSGVQSVLGFQADLTDTATGLVDMGTRQYLPSLGRFTTSDVLFGDPRNPTSLNQFVYAHDNPVSLSDPDGMCPRDPDNPGACSVTAPRREVKRFLRRMRVLTRPVHNFTTRRLLGINGPEPRLDLRRILRPPRPHTAPKKGGGGLGGFLNILQTGLDVVGLIPVVGEVADLANAGIYLARGNHADAALSMAAMIPGAGWAATGAKWTRRATKILPSSGKTFAVTARGTAYDIPPGWVGRSADNRRGIVFQRPGAKGNADSIRIMDPTKKYKSGYVRYFNQQGQPLDVYGQPGPPSTTHIPQDYRGPWPGWPS